MHVGTEMISIRPGLPSRLIAPGDAWIKRRVHRFVQANNGTAGITVTWGDVWAAITCGPAVPATTPKQPWIISSGFDVKLSSVRMFCQTPGAYMEADLFNDQLVQSYVGSNNRTIASDPILSTKKASLGFKIPFTARRVQSNVLPANTTPIMILRTPGTGTAGVSFLITMSLKIKV